LSGCIEKIASLNSALVKGAVGISLSLSLTEIDGLITSMTEEKSLYLMGEFHPSQILIPGPTFKK